jgi:hypothetical protein
MLPQLTDNGVAYEISYLEVCSPAEAKEFFSSLCVQTSSGAHPASCTMGTRSPIPGGNAQPGCDVDNSPPSSAEVMTELDLYLLSPQAPPWHVAGLLYFLLHYLIMHNQFFILPIPSSFLNANTLVFFKLHF